MNHFKWNFCIFLRTENVTWYDAIRWTERMTKNEWIEVVRMNGDRHIMFLLKFKFMELKQTNRKEFYLLFYLVQIRDPIPMILFGKNDMKENE